MKPDGRMANIAPGHGGIERDPATLASHELFPGGQEAMLRRCLKVSVDVRRDGQGVQCTVECLAQDVGHRVPTGFIDRHLILAIEAFDADDRPLEQQAGPRLDKPAGDLSGRAGRLFARLLTDEQGRGPLPFWQAVDEPVDTRLAPGQPVHTLAVFPPQTVQLRIRLIYRRFWQETALAKGWPQEQIVVFEERFPAPSN